MTRVALMLMGLILAPTTRAAEFSASWIHHSEIVLQYGYRLSGYLIKDGDIEHSPAGFFFNETSQTIQNWVSRELKRTDRILINWRQLDEKDPESGYAVKLELHNIPQHYYHLLIFYTEGPIDKLIKRIGNGKDAEALDSDKLKAVKEFLAALPKIKTACVYRASFFDRDTAEPFFRGVSGAWRSKSYWIIRQYWVLNSEKKFLETALNVIRTTGSGELWIPTFERRVRDLN